MKGLSTLLALAAVVCFTPYATAAVTYTGSGTGVDGHDLNAEVTFDAVGGNLVITLTNLGPDALVPADVLTGIFFDVAGDPDLSAVSAVLGVGSSVLFPPSGDGTEGGTGSVGSEWAYVDGLSGPEGTSYGIGSAGYGLFGPGDRFNTAANLQGPADPDGMQYGIVSGIGEGANPALSGSSAFIDDTVVFTLSGWGSLDLNTISNVWFQYGTSLTEPRIAIVPEPATVLLLGLGIACLAARRVRKTR